jgi:hypothetical protein
MNLFKTALGLGGLGGLLLAASAFAKDAPDPKLPKEIKDMYCLVGQWQGDFQYEMGGAKGTAKATIGCTPTSSGYGLACKAHFSGLPGGSSAEETDLFGFDPGARKYHWFSVTSMGETHDHVAELPTGPTIHWLYRGTSEGKPMEESISMTFSADEKRIDFTNDGTVGGQKAWSMKGPLLKK